MTRPEITNKRDLTFSAWIRKNLPDSGVGYMVSDLDFIIQNFKEKKLMLLEIKTQQRELAPWQLMLFKNLEKWIKKGIDADWKFYGFHTIVFEKTNFEDGNVYLDGTQVSEYQLKKYLSFEHIDICQPFSC